MADVTERIYANKITVINNDGSESPQHGATVQLETRYTGDYSGAGVYNMKRAKFRFDFSASQNAKKKKVKEANLKLMLRSGHVTGSGQLPSGSVFDGELRRAQYLSELFFLPFVSGETINTISKPGIGPNINVTNQEPHILDEIGYITIAVGATNNFYSGTTYNVTGGITFDGLTGPIKPYLDIVFTDIVPSAYPQTPTGGGYINEKADNVFSWNQSLEKTYSGDNLNTTHELIWKRAGEEVEHTINVTGESYVYTDAFTRRNAVVSFTVPASTFPEGEISWTVVTTTSEGIKNPGKIWSNFITTDTAPDKPTNLKPDGQMVNGDIENIFSWKHNVATGTPQSKAELELSANGSIWKPLKTVIGNNQEVPIGPGELTAGKKYWRVKTYNSDNIASEWSDHSEIVVKASMIPAAITSISSEPRPLIKWNAAGQIGWRIVIKDANGKIYDTGEKYGREKEYRLNKLLTDGISNISLSVADENGTWAETKAEFSTKNQPQGVIGLMPVALAGKTAKLQWNTASDFDKCYILRDGKPIGKTSGKEYIDKNSIGKVKYRILGMKGSNYSLSNEVEVDVKVLTAVLYDMEADGKLIPLGIKKDSPVVIKRATGGNVSYHHFAGQKHPTACESEYLNSTLSISITRKNSETEEIKNAIGHLCCIKDKTDTVTFAVLDSVSEEVERWSDLTLSFTQVEHEEEVDYE